MTGPGVFFARDQSAPVQLQSPGGVELIDVHKVYGGATARAQALAGITAVFSAGTFTAVMGPSGSGKSTLLQCAAGLDTVSSGVVRVGGVRLDRLSPRALTILRRDRIGFVFQAFNLIPSLTAQQNIELPRRLAGRPAPAEDVAAALAAMGLSHRAAHRPSELSGGEQQRVAIARAVVTGPAVVFADEPTGALDSATSREVLQVLRDLVDRGTSLTVVMVTHDPVAAAYADRVLFLADGRIAGELEGPTAELVAGHLATAEAAA